jgi:hypothetical protein
MPMLTIVLFRNHAAGLEADCAEHGLAYPGQSAGPLLTRLTLMSNSRYSIHSNLSRPFGTGVPWEGKKKKKKKKPTMWLHRG